MSDMTSASTSTTWDWKPGQIPGAIRQQLERLRRAMTRSLWVSGASKMVLIGLTVLLIDFLLDYYFQMDQSQRAIMMALMAGSFVYSAYQFLWIPLTAQVTDDALVLTVEQKLGQEHSELINSLQLAREAGATDRNYSKAMAQQVVKQGAELAGRLDFLQAVDQEATKRKQRWLTAGLVGVVVWGLLVVGTDVGWLWFHRNLLLANQPWPTQTTLTVEGLIDGVLYVPRGEDHRLAVLVDKDCPEPNVDVFLDFVGRSSSSRQKLRQDGQEPLRHTTTLRGINSEFVFQVRGGDFVSPPIPVRLVLPPGFAELALQVVPPAYCGLEATELPLSAESFKVLQGSQLLIRAKPDQTDVQLALLRGSERLAMSADSDGRFSLTLAGDQLVSGRYQFDLADAAGVRSSRPVQFVLDVVPDRAPQVRTRYFGVSGLVVPQAIIPVNIAIEDEFAIQEAWGDLDWQADGSPTKGEKRFDARDFTDQWGANQLSGSFGFDLRPLDIPTGMTLNVVVKARDNQPAPSDPADQTDQTDQTVPGVGAAKALTFRVVTEAELRADLLRRELEQTKTFERLIVQQQAIQTELQALLVSQQEPTETAESHLIRQTQMAGKSQRNQHQVGTLLTQVTDRFRGFLAEVRNNRLDESSAEIDGGQGLAVRLEEQIIGPLDEIEQTLLPQLSRSLEAISRTVGNPTEMRPQIETALPQIEEVLRRLQLVLDAMQRSQSFQEIVNMVISIKNEEQRLKKLAEEKKRAESGLDEIFD
ncbi:MAG: hypothetical protein JNK57_00390 [Planctomycetaceae bacterium]|nr:hypothetical protein [Planctomycetaceae bacterium]